MNKKHFEKLTPVKNAELKIYNDALDFVFKNGDIRNIAISGAYSAGKSSVVESYKQRHKELKFLHVSLANFETTEQEDSKSENKSKNSNNRDINAQKNINNPSVVKESILEGKILNQLLHQIDVSKIPQTNFRVKQKISYIDILNITLMTMIFLICSFHIRFYSKWGGYVDNLPQDKFKDFLKPTTESISLLFSGLIVTGIVGVYLIAKIIDVIISNASRIYGGYNLIHMLK